MSTKIVFVELNEVPFRVLDDFVRRRPQSWLARRIGKCQQFETVAPDRGELSPWVTWPTVHRGVDNQRHGIASFGQELGEVDREFPPFWQIVAAQGISTGLFGSLHSHAGFVRRGAHEQYAFFVPDTFAAGSECFPAKLAEFQQLNLAMVEQSGRNVSTRVPWASALRLLAHAPGLGLKPQTLLDAGLQLLSERLKWARRVRRRTLQAMLGFDVFMRQLERTRPVLSLYFTNHVASAMHRFWAAAFPDDYTTFGLTHQWVADYRDEIDFTLSKLDGMLGRLIRFVERTPDYSLWIATSMGQAATAAEPVNTELHMADMTQFMAALGMPAGCWTQRKAMAPDWNVLVHDDQRAHFEAALQRIKIAGQPIACKKSDHGFFNVRLGQQNLATIEFDGQAAPPERVGLTNIHVQDGAKLTAYHIPQGALLLYDPRHAAAAAARVQIPTVEIAPMLLRRLGVDLPSYMRHRRLAA